MKSERKKSERVRERKMNGEAKMEVKNES